MPDQPKVARVLFDESHSEAWTIRRELARQMQPSHPEDSSYAAAAEALASRDFEVGENTERPLTRETLAAADVLVIAHPSDPKWEATTNSRTPRLSDRELDAIEEFVRGGGGLIALGETEQEKYGNNLNDLLSRFGIEVSNCTVQDYEHHLSAPSWVLAELENGPNGELEKVDLLARVHQACFYRTGTLALHNGGRVIARSSPTASPPGAPLAAITEHGDGRVVVLADSDLFGDDCIGEVDNESLWLNLVYWAAQPAFAGVQTVVDSPPRSDPSWADLKAAVEELRLIQDPDGSVDLSKHDADRPAALVEAISNAAGSLARHFPHQMDYIDALGQDLRAWVDADFAKPDFASSLEAFRPERDRRHGIEHLVVFPMYKQNASRDTCFEALIVRVPWPAFVAELERSGYDNPKFVPVNFVDYTAGYDSECAVLFPETFSTAERPLSYFGGIFCDREAERFRRVCGRAAELLGLNLPPDAACLLTSPELSMDAYVVWDLIHDRTHMHGDLPFDPFMIRQRSPYWMYSLEELRCDLTAFAEAVKLEHKGFAFARYVQYTILFDRLFRFPVTGSRMRNYDGLGGQLLFAFLHREGYLHWTDNRLTIDWERVAEGVGALRERVQDLYHSGIDRSKLGQWVAAHDLVATYVPPAPGSRWATDGRDLPEVDEPKELVDLVKDDEFPLSLFYVQLQGKLEPALTRPDDAL
ncbi:MAG: hypothetical protein AUG48_08810 [Actinobacteria bacterium 13_1_20CM_3_68_9]|nr:MAG: hypothetical protein AUG48_08810 [Actinobacteria bacterium 13_1_20CM_3_68_9]